MVLLSDLYTQNPGAQPTTAAAPAAAPGSVTPAQATAATAQAAPGAVATTTGPAAQAAATQASGGTLAQMREAAATGYDAHTQDVPGANLASSQLAGITAEDSPLMKRARQEGILTAARRGLQNSSIAAGTAQGAMVDRAAPIASQNATQLQEQSLANQAAINRAREVSSGRETDVSVANANLGTQTSQFNAGQANEADRLNAQLGTATNQQNASEANRLAGINAELGTRTSQFNAEQQNEIARLNAQLETATSQGNAQEVNAIRTRLAELATQVNMQGADINARANELTARAENDLRQTVLQQNAQLNQQYLAGTQALDLEQIRGRYETLLQQNRSASSLYESYFQSISSVMSNPNLLPERAAQIVGAQQAALEAGLRLVAAMNSLDAPPAPGTPPLTGEAPPPSIPSPSTPSPQPGGAPAPNLNPNPGMEGYTGENPGDNYRN